MDPSGFLALIQDMVRKPPPPVVSPHVMPRNQEPPVILEPEPKVHEMYPAADRKANAYATYWYQEAVKRGMKPDAAARLARSNALNRMFKLGLYKPPVSSKEY